MHQHVHHIVHAREVKRMAKLYFDKNILKFSIVKCINYAQNDTDYGNNSNSNCNKFSYIGNLKLAFERWHQLVDNCNKNSNICSFEFDEPLMSDESNDYNATTMTSSSSPTPSSPLDNHVLYFANRQLKKPKQFNLNYLNDSSTLIGEEDTERKTFYKKNLRLSFASEIINTIMQLRRNIKEL